MKSISYLSSDINAAYQKSIRQNAQDFLDTHLASIKDEIAKETGKFQLPTDGRNHVIVNPVGFSETLTAKIKSLLSTIKGT